MSRRQNGQQPVLENFLKNSTTISGRLTLSGSKHIAYRLRDNDMLTDAELEEVSHPTNTATVAAQILVEHVRKKKSPERILTFHDILRHELHQNDLADLIIPLIQGMPAEKETFTSTTYPFSREEIIRSIGPRQLHLTLPFLGNELKDGSSPCDYCTSPGSIFHLVIHLHSSMPISVKKLPGKTIIVYADPRECIGNVKAKVEDKKERQRLVFDGRYLEDGNCLCDYNILNKSTLHLVKRVPSIMQVFINTPTGRKLVLKVNPWDSIGNVKEKLGRKEGFEPKNLRLIMPFLGKSLEDDRNLSDYDIHDGSTLEVVQN